MPRNFESGYANGVRIRQLAGEKAERAKIFAESYLKSKKRKSPFGAIKERMDTVKKHSIKQGIGAAAIKFRRKKKTGSSVSSGMDTPKNDALLIPGQPLAPGQEGMLTPPAPVGPPPEPENVKPLHQFSADSHEFLLGH